MCKQRQVTMTSVGNSSSIFNIFWIIRGWFQGFLATNYFFFKSSPYYYPLTTGLISLLLSSPTYHTSSRQEKSYSFGNDEQFTVSTPHRYEQCRRHRQSAGPSLSLDLIMTCKSMTRHQPQISYSNGFR